MKHFQRDVKNFLEKSVNLVDRSDMYKFIFENVPNFVLLLDYTKIIIQFDK